MKKDILIGILAIVIGISAIFGVYKIDQSQKFSRALKRAADLEFVKTELEKYKSEKGNYPSTDLKFETDKQLIYRETPVDAPAPLKPEPAAVSTPRLYEGNFLSECDHPKNYIPGVSFALPFDSSGACQLLKGGYYGGDHAAKYAYASDGKDYKFIVLYLGDEFCGAYEQFEQYIDPARGCGNYNAAWSVYSAGAKWW